MKTVYPALSLNAKYWEENRKADGLYYYDSEDTSSPDYLTHVGWESGWDNSVRWDNDFVDCGLSTSTALW